MCLAYIEDIALNLTFVNHLMNFHMHDFEVFFTNKYFELDKEINIYALTKI